MHTLRTAFFLALSLALYAAPALAQDGPPTTGATTTFQIDLAEGANLVSLPALPDSMRVGAIVADVLPHLTFVQDDAGRYFIPAQGIDGIGIWNWDEAYKFVVTSPTSFFIEGAAILPEASPLLIDGQVGNWVPYFRQDPMAVEEAFASIAPYLSRVEAGDGRFYHPGDDASTLDSLRTGQGYKVWVSQPVTLTYPANSLPPDTTPPAAPAGLTASAGNNAVVLNWSGNTDGDLAGVPYLVKRSVSAGGPYAPIAAWGQTAYADGTAANGTTYYYVVTARDESGNESAPSEEVAATPQASSGGDTTPPSLPTGLSATASSGSVALDWNDNTDGDLADVPYTVKRSGTAGGPYVPIASVGQSTYADATAANGTTYFYVVTAVDTSGNESPPSTEVAATPQAPPPPPDTTPPVAPSGLTASASNGSVALNWNDNGEGDLAGVPYTVKRGATAGGPYTTIASVSASAHTDGTVVNGVTYYYVVTATDGDGNESPPSTEAVATPQAPPPPDTTPPVAPSGLTASASNGSVALNWNDNGEGDLAGVPYTVKRGATAGGPYTTIASVSASAHTDGAVVNGTTYYYVVTATDDDGNESAPSAEVSATPQGSTGPFALPASPLATATEEAIGMRAEFRADPKGFNNHLTTAYDGATTQGERLWLGLGGTGYDWGHPTPAVEPDGAGGIRATYVTAAGTLAELPPLGTAPGTGGYPAPYIFGHEGTDIGARVEYPDGSTAVHFLVMDGGPSPNFSYRFVEEASGAQRLDTIRVYGTIWENGAKNHALEATEGGMVAIHAHSSPYHTNTPNLLVNRGDDANFFVPGSSSGGSANFTFRLGAVDDEIFIVTNESPVLSVLSEVGADSAYVQRRIVNPATFWGSQATISNGFGPTPKYVGPAAGNPGFVIYTGGASRLDYHNGASGSVIPVDEVSAYVYQRLGGETWRITYPDLRVQRLAALNVGPSAATPTWVTEADLDLPTGWDPANVMHAEITENGSVWLIGRRLATFPATGTTANDIAVAYYRGGNP